MKIFIETGHPDYLLSLNDIKDVGNDTYECTLNIRSKWITCERQFFFDVFHIKQFLENLEIMNNHFKGDAILKEQFEEQKIILKCNSLGKVTVSSSLVEHSDSDQSAEISFETDQTIISPLINQFSKLLN